MKTRAELKIAFCAVVLGAGLTACQERPVDIDRGHNLDRRAAIAPAPDSYRSSSSSYSASDEDRNTDSNEESVDMDLARDSR